MFTVTVNWPATQLPKRLKNRLGGYLGFKLPPATSRANSVPDMSHMTCRTAGYWPILPPFQLDTSHPWWVTLSYTRNTLSKISYYCRRRDLAFLVRCRLFRYEKISKILTQKKHFCVNVITVGLNLNFRKKQVP